MNIVLIRAVSSDLDYLWWLRQHTMVAHLERQGLYYDHSEHLSKIQEHFDCAHIIWVDGVKTGLLKFVSTAQQVDIKQLQIAPLWQGKGLGRAILLDLFTCHPRKHYVLTVLKNNPALRLYQRLGFNIVAEDQYEYHMRLSTVE